MSFALATLPLDEGGHVVGFQIGRAVALLDWQHAKEAREFSRLCRLLSWRKSAKKRWREMDSVTKARIIAYRKHWAAEHPDQVRASSIAAKRRRRQRPEIHAAEIAERRAKRAALSAQRRREIIYTCDACGAQWCLALGRIPSRPPLYCSQPCRSRANYQRGKAAGKPWAKRTREFRSDRITGIA